MIIITRAFVVDILDTIISINDAFNVLKRLVVTYQNYQPTIDDAVYLYDAIRIGNDDIHDIAEELNLSLAQEDGLNQIKAAFDAIPNGYNNKHEFMIWFYS